MILFPSYPTTPFLSDFHPNELIQWQRHPVANTVLKLSQENELGGGKCCTTLEIRAKTSVISTLDFHPFE